MILQVNLLRAEITHRQCSSRNRRKGFFFFAIKRVCRESSLLWPVEAVESASGLPTNDWRKAFGTEQQQPPYPRLWFRKRLVVRSAAGSAWRAALVAVHQA